MHRLSPSALGVAIGPETNVQWCREWEHLAGTGHALSSKTPVVDHVRRQPSTAWKQDVPVVRLFQLAAKRGPHSLRKRALGPWPQLCPLARFGATTFASEKKDTMPGIVTLERHRKIGAYSRNCYPALKVDDAGDK